VKALLVEEARARMLAHATELPHDIVSAGECLGRVLAEPITASRDQPPFAASAMDGYAVRSAATAVDARLKVVGESAAGGGYAEIVGPGEAVRIFTGAPVPAGADAVVIQEDTERDGQTVILKVSPQPNANIRPAGGDFRSGDALLAKGMRLDPWRLSLAAAAGRDELEVCHRPVVAILSTGEEIVPAGDSPGPHQIFDSGSPALAALVRIWGGEPRRLSPAGDRIEAIEGALRTFPCDLIVTIGGASVGDHDLVKPAMARLGLELVVESIRMRPGKPTWFGVLADGRRVLGLPGNPASALACAELFLRPLLMAMQGVEPASRVVSARVSRPLPANGPREHWMRARLRNDAGMLIAEPMADQDSSLVSVFAQADALLKRPIDAPAAPAGEVVEVLPLERL